MTWRSVFITIIVLSVLFILPSLIARIYAVRHLYSITDTPSARVAIVFGAGLWRDGSPTPVLKDRVATGVQLFKEGKVEKLLMTGDNSTIYYNEPAAMKAYAIELGMPESDIVLDYAGRRTYDSCYRALHIFQVNDAILVTQAFHQPRALWICHVIGLEAKGVIASTRPFSRWDVGYWQLREFPATFRAFMDCIFRPKPILGEVEPIFPEQ